MSATGKILIGTATILAMTLLSLCGDKKSLKDHVSDKEIPTKSIKAKTMMTDAIMDEGVFRDTCIIGWETYAIAEESVSMNDHGHEARFSLRKLTDNVASYFVVLRSYGWSAWEAQQIYTIQVFNTSGNDITKTPEGEQTTKAFLTSGQQSVQSKKNENTEWWDDPSLTETINGTIITPSTAVSTIVSFVDQVFGSGETMWVWDPTYQKLKKSLSLWEQQNGNLDNIIRTETFRADLRNHLGDTYQITPDVLMSYAANSEMIGNHRLWWEKGKATKLVIYLQLLCNSYRISTHFNEDGLWANSLGIDGIDRHATRQAINHLVAMFTMEAQISRLVSQKQQSIDKKSIQTITTVLSEHITRHFGIEKPTTSWENWVMNLWLPNNRKLTFEPTADWLKVSCFNKRFPHIQNIRSIQPLFAWQDIADNELFGEEYSITLSDFFMTVKIMTEIHHQLDTNKDIPRNGFLFDGDNLMLNDTSWRQIRKSDTSRQPYQDMFIRMNEQQKKMFLVLLNGIIDVYRVKK